MKEAIRPTFEQVFENAKQNDKKGFEIVKELRSHYYSAVGIIDFLRGKGYDVTMVDIGKGHFRRIIISDKSINELSNEVVGFNEAIMPHM